jgi:pimeloyl-ACP methyl ester carboxylesterase
LKLADLRPLPPQRLTTLELGDGAVVHVRASLASTALLAGGAAAGAAAAAPAFAAQAAPLVIVLHGMCSDPANDCARWSDAAAVPGWLLCPSGDTPCDSGYDWSPGVRERARHLDGVLGMARAQWQPWLGSQPAVLVGFSRGAFVARDVAQASPGRYRGLLLIGAAVELEPERLREAGVRRVVLACGDLDGARPSMVHAAAVLRSAGLPTRFVSTGRIYHQLPADVGATLGAALGWLVEA